MCVGRSLGIKTVMRNRRQKKARFAAKQKTGTEAKHNELEPTKD